ncbi:MAG: biotin synthase [Helicobacteraceae bacterium]|jgi:biotin synthase|nr:biotin synthase [Helicobacteraceae bacterium]
MDSIFLCAISNIASGSCNEDCGFCAQSARYQTKIERFRSKPIERICQEAKAAAQAGAVGYCLVTAGRSITDETLEYVSKAARAVKALDLDLKIIACNGTGTKEQFAELKKNGVDLYNHNLETSERFFPNICSTHSWRERYETNEAAASAGLGLVLGGIFGMGESDEDRLDLLRTIASFKPMSSPMNFYIARPELPIKQPVMSADEALKWVKKAREILGPMPRIMLAGGKEQAFGDRLMEAIGAGANAMVVGNYLTTEGMDSSRLKETIESAGYKVATSAECKAAFAAMGAQ